MQVSEPRARARARSGAFKPDLHRLAPEQRNDQSLLYEASLFPLCY